MSDESSVSAVVPAVLPAPEASGKGGPRWRGVAVGAVAGLVIGAGGVGAAWAASGSGSDSGSGPGSSFTLLGTMELTDAVDVDAILSSLGEEYFDTGDDPWGGANLDPGDQYDADGIDHEPHRTYSDS